MSACKHDVIVSTKVVEAKVAAAVKVHGMDVIFTDTDKKSGQTLRILGIDRADINLNNTPNDQYVLLSVQDDGEYRFNGSLPRNLFGLEIELTAGVEISSERLKDVQKKLRDIAQNGPASRSS